jgi:hypothetical protein
MAGVKAIPRRGETGGPDLMLETAREVSFRFVEEMSD